ncbi:uncharacterized protein LOC143534587 [Bidens hawaiensis]|uniref:uncharacterized protein LOC143534587 n=1 Tax=Bidens hawaiensis TaxID=980011 RepID=UPI00404B8974
MKVWGCIAETIIYNPFLKKLDPKTDTYFFIGNPENSKGYRFYCPSHVIHSVETKRVEFLEDYKINGSSTKPYEELQEIQDARGDSSIIVTLVIPLVPNAIEPIAPTSSHSEPIITENEGTSSTENQDKLNPLINLKGHLGPEDLLTLKIMSPTWIEADAEMLNDPISYSEAINSEQSAEWNKLNDELDFMKKNDVWDLVELPNGVKPVEGKWVFKTKLDPNGKVERHKVRMVAKGYTQK